ncbi:polymorphic toxin-type HINT domain-containing protein [Paenibacillus campi]|uniref:polymorphic toxin-type HINT domain-containing protein n=1 Tax=Paenibacillus campi TaxID=3106031 RepID=UPI002AFF71F6|nr:polymorphic toxin-type HINT domain-containing protein [Paenibacillus sp. SGZ-1014]
MYLEVIKSRVIAIDLKVGDRLKQSNGHVLAIEQIEVVHHEQKVKVYNFTVAEYHTYFVSDLGIWVHNINCTFTNGELFETSIKSKSGLLIKGVAEVEVKDSTLILKDLAIYPDGVVGNAAKNSVGAKDFVAWKNQVKEMAKEQGFNTLKITGVRAPNLSSANPGKIIDYTFDLIK